MAKEAREENKIPVPPEVTVKRIHDYLVAYLCSEVEGCEIDEKKKNHLKTSIKGIVRNTQKQIEKVLERVQLRGSQ